MGLQSTYLLTRLAFFSNVTTDNAKEDLHDLVVLKTDISSLLVIEINNSYTALLG